jgi:hypothetical protein
MCRRGIVVACTIENSTRTQKASLVKDAIVGQTKEKERKGCKGAAVEAGSREGCTGDDIYIDGHYASD